MRRLALALLVSLTPVGAMTQEPVCLHAAGSLRQALGEVAASFSVTKYGVPVKAEWGASGLLRERIAGGEKTDVFASANLEHPRTLAAAGTAGPVVVFARNRLCLLARPGLSVTPETALDRMLEPGLKLGTSTPRADPSGDYAWSMFQRAEAVRAGSRAALEAKALKLTGGPDSPRAPPGRSIYAHLIESGGADLFLTYCTNGREAVAQVTGATRTDLPPALAVGADYGLVVLRGASEAAHLLALHILSPEGQRILARHGFNSPGLPAFAD